MRQAQTGHARAFDQLFERFQRAVTAYCLAASHGDRDRALDLTQEIFIRSFRNITDLAEPERFEGWLFSIAANQCRSMASSDQRRARVLDAVALGAEEGSVHDGLGDKGRRERRIALIQRVLAAIEDPTLKTVITMKYGEPEHTTREIAARLALPHGTVTNKLMRFRAAIKRDLLAALLEVEEEIP
ncbi:MAG: RNA polymerase sigma factor [Deltaproteobacteria bacterium]|nr:RNA polymerase sigma factor [Deltaproteobacteria bacterium]